MLTSADCSTDVVSGSFCVCVEGAWVRGKTYEGDRDSRGMKHGTGTMTFANGIYVSGQWQNDMLNGEGVSGSRSLRLSEWCLGNVLSSFFFPKPVCVCLHTPHNGSCAIKLL